MQWHGEQNTETKTKFLEILDFKTIYTHYSNQDHVVIAKEMTKPLVKKKGPETDAHNAVN